MNKDKEIRDHLVFLYGEPRAGILEEQVFCLIEERFGRKGVKCTVEFSFSERDVLLITYGDQLNETGRKPLEVLGEFAETKLSGVVNGIHILPFYPWSSDDGFAVKEYFAVDPALGNWHDIEALGKRFSLMVDGVFNHVSAQGEWFQRFLAGDSDYNDFFIIVNGEPDLSQVVRPRVLPLLSEFETSGGRKKVWTTFSADQVDLNFQNPQVLLRVLDALLFYVTKGAKFIRLDAIAFLWKEIGTPCLHLPQTHRAVQLMRAVLDEVAPDVALITETNVPHADNISYFGDGTNEAQLVYNFALPPLVLHSVAAGDTKRLTTWAKSLKTPSSRVSFFNFLASHDGIGINPVRGILTEEEIGGLISRTRAHGGYLSAKLNPNGSKSVYELNINYFDALSNPFGAEPEALQIDRFLAAQCVMLAIDGIPGIYFHSLFGSRGDRAGAESSGIPRRINRQKLSRSDLESELGNSQTLRSQVFSRLRQVLQARSRCDAFAPGAGQDVLEIDSRVFAVLRKGRHQTALCLHNLSSENVRLQSRLAGLMPGVVWGVIVGNSAAMEDEDITLRPYEVVWATSDSLLR